MQTVQILHNILRWGILLFGLLTVFSAISGVMGKRPYSSGDNRNNLLFMIFFDIQLLLGLGLFFSNHWFHKLRDGMGAVMKNPVDRFFTIEHSLLMIIAWILVHAGRTAVKKAVSDESKHKKTLIFAGIALVLILVSIPWPFRAEIARPLVRWFN